MENEWGEESIDSIPRPEYEAIQGGSTKSTPTPPPQGDEDGDDDVEGEEESDELDEKGILEEAEVPMDAEEAKLYEADYDDYANDEGGEDDLKNKTINSANKASINIVQSADINSPVPMQIIASVNTPKMLPVKTKDNKLVMVQLVDETGKTFTQAANAVMPNKIAEWTSGTTAKMSEDVSQPKVQSNVVRSSTPISREVIALQKSVNESKILSEFVTGPKNRKSRKSGVTTASKESSAERTPSKPLTNSEENLAKVEKRRDSSTSSLNQLYKHITADNVTPVSSVPSSAEKPRKSSKFAPLKDELSSSCTSNWRPRSRSKSVNRKSPMCLDSSRQKLKKWPSDEKILKRTNMRSQNSEFVQKQVDFLNRIIRQQGDEAEPSDMDDGEQSIVGECDEILVFEGAAMNESNGSILVNCASLSQSQSSILADNSMVDSGIVASADGSEAHLRGIWQPPPKRGWDSFCWKCRDCGHLIPCSKCVRSFHTTCIKVAASTKLDQTWVCPECSGIDNVLSGPKKSRRNELSLELLSQLLSFALKRMKNVKGYSKFLIPYEEFPNYARYIINPVTFASLQEKIEKKVFRCAEEIVNETKWMLHNSLILTNVPNSKEVVTAKSILKICRQEANEIDTCAECYLNANTRSGWFVDVCAHPHLLLWAKLKGFPYWPAKAMGPGQGSHVNVRFFGEHDRAFVPVKDCFLFSEQDPNTQTGKRSARELADCIKEVEVHIEKIKSKIGDFRYANLKTAYDPSEELQQLERMMPGVMEYMKRQQALVAKPSLQYKIVKTADNHLSIIKKADANESGNDSDHSGSPSKKKLLENSEAAETNKMKVATSKYEVVSKTTSDESNSSKVSTVILKRKSDGSEHRKTDAELPLPKMTKIEESMAEEQRKLVAASSGKRKHVTEATAINDSDSEKHKSKHAKHEPRVPMLTIKTCGRKDVEPTTALEDAATTVMAHLVKNKQGVTIKKIPKESGKKTANEIEGTAKSDNVSKSQDAPTQESATQEAVPSKETPAEASNEKAKLAQKVTNILKDLVPFFEIKKEVNSDDEAAENEINLAKNIKGKEEANSAPAPTANEAVVTPSTSTPSHAHPATTQPETNQENPLLNTVKQEVVSEGEEELPGLQIKETTSAGNLQTNLDSSQADKSAAVISGGDVRMVGDTTIQRVSMKNANTSTPQQNYQPNTSTPTSTAAAMNSITLTQSNSGTKRSTNRVPYGPLPASAMPTAIVRTTINSTNSPNSSRNCAASNSNANINTLNVQQQQQLQQLRQNQRARKTFPNRSPNEISPPRNAKSSNAPAGAQVSPSQPPPAPHSNADLKGSLMKTSMVSIPVDVANSRSSNSIPVPPLTAVSKTTPISASPISTVATAVTATTTSTSAFASCNGISALTMSAPPPLAGLSQTSTSSVTSNSAVVVATSATSNGGLPENVPNTQVTNTTSGSVPVVADAAPLLGDFVTPALASAITEVICRGPPKMAPRPNGPLQSDGSTLFPSQAGPVCRTLVENAHKLADFFISVMEDTMCEMSAAEEPDLHAKNTLLTMELERTKQACEREVAELKRTSDLLLVEMRKSMEAEKKRIINETRMQCELERLRSVEETKKKQWCANCGHEAQFYCCWNTSYCDYRCQQLHWSRHAASCAQIRPSSNEATTGVNISASGSSAAASGQQERQHAANKSSMNPSSNASTTSITHYNKTVIGNKKEKNSSKNSSISTVMPTQPAEVLKLPTNTYLRAIPATGNNAVRSSTYALPVQRFNIPLPLTAPVNTGGPYTIVQRGNNWEFMSTATNNAGQSVNSSISTVAAPLAEVPSTAQQQARLVANSMGTKSGGRNRSAMTMNSTQCGGVLRPTQM